MLLIPNAILSIMLYLAARGVAAACFTEYMKGPPRDVIPIPNQGAIFVGSSSAPQRTTCTPSSPQSSPP